MYTLSVLVVTLGVAIAFNPIEPFEDIIKDTLFPDNPCFSLIPYIKKYVEDTSDCSKYHMCIWPGWLSCSYSCERGTSFNPEREDCSGPHPDKVPDCYGQSKPGKLLNFTKNRKALPIK